jgi:hypothetical protein
MIDEWVQDVKTGEAWRLDRDRSRPVYRTEGGAIKYRDGLETMSKYRFYPCCPKEAPVNRAPETGAQMTIFDFLNFSEGAESTTETGEMRERATPDPLEEKRAFYESRGYRPRIAEALARKELGMENPDAFLLERFHITGEDKNT